MERSDATTIPFCNTVDELTIMEDDDALDTILETKLEDVDAALSNLNSVNVVSQTSLSNAAYPLVVPNNPIAVAVEPAAKQATAALLNTAAAPPISIPAAVHPATVRQTTTVPKPKRTVPNRTGRWTMDEKLLFLHGLQQFGKGRWKQIQQFIPGRSLIQIKSHGQKVLQKFRAGQNIYARLEDHATRLTVLLDQLSHGHLGNEESSNHSSNNNHHKPASDILAASALCSLGGESHPNTTTISGPPVVSNKLPVSMPCYRGESTV